MSSLARPIARRLTDHDDRAVIGAIAGTFTTSIRADGRTEVRWTANAGTLQVLVPGYVDDLTVVGGGSSGGTGAEAVGASPHGAGGAGGGVLYVSRLWLPAGTYAISVSPGGAARTAQSQPGVEGVGSRFGSLWAPGGRSNVGMTGATSGNGWTGGTGGWYSGGGGGGADGPGGNATDNWTGGLGGPGLLTPAGLFGVGGKGGDASAPVVDGPANTGNGGTGGYGTARSGAGGSGIVVIAF